MSIVRFLALAAIVAAMTGCTVNIRSTGANAKFELSPARDVAQNATFDVCNGLSAGLPTNWETSQKNAESGEEKPAAENK